MELSEGERRLSEHDFSAFGEGLSYLAARNAVDTDTDALAQISSRFQKQNQKNPTSLQLNIHCISRNHSSTHLYTLLFLESLRLQWS